MCTFENEPAIGPSRDGMVEMQLDEILTVDQGATCFLNASETHETLHWLSAENICDYI